MFNLWQTLITILLSGGIVGVIIAYYFNKKLEEYRFLISRREKAANIATALAKWIKYRASEPGILNRKELIDYYEELTRMSFEISLWVEDEKILQKIMNLFSHDPSAPNVREVLMEVRKIILGKEAKEFKANDIIIWPSDEKVDAVFNKVTSTHKPQNRRWKNRSKTLILPQ